MLALELNPENNFIYFYYLNACIESHFLFNYFFLFQNKLKTRIESLERLLAEERQKLHLAEKKLALAGEQVTSPSLSDDVKLRLREKELLQEEVRAVIRLLPVQLLHLQLISDVMSMSKGFSHLLHVSSI